MSTGQLRAHGPRNTATRSAIVAVVIAVVVVAHAGAPRADAPPADTVAATGSVDDRVRQHSLGIGFESLYFHTRSADDYTMQGPSLVYDFFIGRRWGFMVRTAWFTALSGQMNGPTGHFDGTFDPVYDQHHYGVDASFMAAHRLPLGSHVIATVALGAHLQWYSLAGLRYSPVEDATAGIGGLARVDYPLNGWLAASSELAAALDPIDLVNHQNPARLTLPLALSFAIAARY